MNLEPILDEVGHRDPKPSDFIGKTISALDASCINIWRFTFTDGSKIAIEVDSFGRAGPGMSICDSCTETVDA